MPCCARLAAHSLKLEACMCVPCCTAPAVFLGKPAERAGGTISFNSSANSELYGPEATTDTLLDHPAEGTAGTGDSKHSLMHPVLSRYVPTPAYAPDTDALL